MPVMENSSLLFSSCHLDICGHGNFSVRGSGPKFFLGGCGGIQMFEVSTIRERNFFLLCFQIFKNHKWNLQVSDAWRYGHGCKINFQMGDLDRVSIKFFRRGIWMVIIAKFLFLKIVHFLLVILTNSKHKMDYFPNLFKMTIYREFACYFQNSRF